MTWLYLYACIGAVLFVLCGGPEAMGEEYRDALRRRGIGVARYLVTVGTIFCVLLWPRFVWNCGKRFVGGGR